MNVRNILTRMEAGPLFEAAIGAARGSLADGNPKMEKRLMGMARDYRYIRRRGKATQRGDASAAVAIKAADLPEEVTAVARELQRMNAIKGTVVVGIVPSSTGGTARRVYAKKHGANLRYLVAPDVKARRASEEKKRPGDAVKEEKERLQRQDAKRKAKTKATA
ncbi:hypothetical protein ABZ543_13260 [Streptomyces roseifaciens]